MYSLLLMLAINIYIKASFQQLVVCIQCGFVVASGYVHCTITIAVSHSKYNCDKTVLLIINLHSKQTKQYVVFQLQTDLIVSFCVYPPSGEPENEAIYCVNV